MIFWNIKIIRVITSLRTILHGYSDSEEFSRESQGLRKYLSENSLTNLPYPTLPYPTLPYLTLPYLTLPYLTLPYLTLPNLT